MELRVVSGLIIISRNAPRGSTVSNNVTIDFLTNSIVGVPPAGVSLDDETEVGPARLFSQVPAKNVSIRQFESFDQTSILAQQISGQSTHRYRIGDTVNARTATISWDAIGEASLIEEISYLFIAPVVDAPDPPGPGNGGDDGDFPLPGVVPD